MLDFILIEHRLVFNGHLNLSYRESPFLKTKKPGINQAFLTNTAN